MKCTTGKKQHRGRFLLLDQENWWGIVDYPVDADVTFTRFDEVSGEAIEQVTVNVQRTITNGMKAGNISSRVVRATQNQQNYQLVTRPDYLQTGLTFPAGITNRHDSGWTLKMEDTVEAYRHPYNAFCNLKELSSDEGAFNSQFIRKRLVKCIYITETPCKILKPHQFYLWRLYGKPEPKTGVLASAH